jgi:transposase
MPTSDREENILRIVERIESSKLSPEAYFQRYEVPFSIAQFYRYRKKLSTEGKPGLLDGRSKGNNKKLGEGEIAFIRGFIKDKSAVSPSVVMRAVTEEFGTTVHRGTMSRALIKLGVDTARRASQKVKKTRVSCAGFELIAAMAIHLGWAAHTAQCIVDVIGTCAERPQPSKGKDTTGRNSKGHFTPKYNQRPTVRKMRFASIEQKRLKKDLRRMDIFDTSMKNLERKSLAVLALPLVTLNGQVRHVNTALGNVLGEFCGYNYKQATLDRFLRELKYLGVSQRMLCSQVRFWRENWKMSKSELELPFLCFYIDGNTKPVWSKYPVRKNKVTMWGRVMGCLEQVFVNDNFGRPIYFETYSGQGPMGVYTLSMMEKIEQYLEEEIKDTHVSRVMVMDGAGNSVATLRAFAAQDRYHYITTLDNNQWSDRKIRHEGVVERYRWGEATLYDSEIELRDSKEKEEYLIVVRAVRIEWDYGKRTVLLTSLPADTVGPSLVVKGYFDRWPLQELTFRRMKGFACLHRVVGYGKQLQENLEVRVKQLELQEKIQEMRSKLKYPLVEITHKTVALTTLIEQERVLRCRGPIKDGERDLSKQDEESLKDCVQEIGRVHRCIKAIEKDNAKDFKKLHRYETSWMRLQGKEFVYKMDVELDQILTYFRVSLTNICAYFLKEIFQGGSLSFSTLMQSILLLDGEVEENENFRKVVITRNPKDPTMMASFEAALDRLNALGLQTLSGKSYRFSLS